MDSRTKIPPLTKILEQSEIEKIPSDILQKIEAFCETCEEKLTASSAFANTSIEELRRDIDEKFEEGKANIADFHDQIKAANSEIDRLNKQVVQQELETNAYRKERNDVINERDHLLKSSDSKQRAINRLQYDIDVLNLQFKSVVSERDNAIARLTKFADKEQCIKYRLKLMVAETDFLNTEIVSLKRQIESGLKKSSDEQAQTEKLQSKLSQARLEIQSKNQQINNLSKMLEEKRASSFAEFEQKRVTQLLVTNEDCTKNNAANHDSLRQQISDKNSEDFTKLPIDCNNLATMEATGKENVHEVIEELSLLKTEIIRIEQVLAEKMTQLQIFVDERKRTQDYLNYLRQMNQQLKQQVFDHLDGNMIKNEQNLIQNENNHDQAEYIGEIYQLQENDDTRNDNIQIVTFGSIEENCQSSKTLTIPNCNVEVESSTKTDPPLQLYTGSSSMTQEIFSTPTTSYADYIAPKILIATPLIEPTKIIPDAGDFPLNTNESLSSSKPSQALKQHVHLSSPSRTMPNIEKCNRKRLSEQSGKMLQENKKTRVNEQPFKGVSESGSDIEYRVHIYSQNDEVDDVVAINNKEVFGDGETIEVDQNVEIENENKIFDIYEDDIYGDNFQYSKNVVIVINDSDDGSNNSWKDVEASSFVEEILGDKIESTEEQRAQTINGGNDLSFSGEESTGSLIQPSAQHLDVQQQTYEGTNNDVIATNTPPLDVGPHVRGEMNSFVQPIVEASGTSLANPTVITIFDNSSKEIINSCTDINLNESDHGDQSTPN